MAGSGTGTGPGRRPLGRRGRGPPGNFRLRTGSAWCGAIGRCAGLGVVQGDSLLRQVWIVGPLPGTLSQGKRQPGPGPVGVSMGVGWD